MSEPFVGQRVVLSSLVHEGTFPGEVVEVNFIDKRTSQPTCTVKLDSQEEPVGWVLYFDEQPIGEINSTLWQVCWPEETE